MVLVNEGTASAAEIIAGALQDHDRALVVGTPDVRQGAGADAVPLGESTALKLTTARWYTPSGRTIQRIATDERDQVLQAMAAVDNGGVVPDSVLRPRRFGSALPEFKTDDGRIVRGGGGIVPDLVVRPDTFTTSEREFVKAIGDKVAAYRDVLTSYALELKNAGTVKSPNFTVTPAMRTVVYDRLEAKGVTMSRATFDGGAATVDHQLGYEIAATSSAARRSSGGSPPTTSRCRRRSACSRRRPRPRP